MTLKPSKTSNVTYTLDDDRQLVTLGRGGVISKPSKTPGLDGTLILKNASDVKTVRLLGRQGMLVLGGDDESGEVIVKAGNDEPTVRINGGSGGIELGGNGQDGDIRLNNASGQNTLHMDGQSGDITFLNADFAEEFQIDETVLPVVLPGTVMIISQSGELVPCDEEYDSRVAGVIAGAEGYKPALILDKTDEPGRLPVAMIGKVFCRVTTKNGEICAGDLLTTSTITGHAQKVQNRGQAIGAVIGKALGNCSEETGLIPVLINLQ